MIFLVTTGFKKKIFIVLVFILSGIFPLYAENNIRLAATDWPPYTGNNLLHGGVAAEIVNAAFARVGYHSKFMVYPWARAQQMVKEGFLDGMGIAWYTEERAINMAYSQPYLKTQIVLIKHRDDQHQYLKLSDLNNKHFGVLRGYGYLNLVQSETIRKTLLGTLAQSFQMLSTKRIDLTLEEKLNAHHHLAQLPIAVQQNIIIGDRPLQVKDLHMTISRSVENYQQIINDFNRGLSQILEDGTYAKILGAYQPLPLGITGSP